MFKDLQGFMESTRGQIVVICVIIVIFLLILIPRKDQKNKKADVKAMTISALLVAIAMVLGQIQLFRMPQGGGITLLSMLPIALCSYYLGTRRGIMAGMCLGLLNLIFGPYVIHPLQLLLDYPIAFGAMGMGGIFRNQKNGLTKGYLFGVFCRYICAVVSGIVFFGAYAPANFNAVTWSLWYNLTYLGVEAAITVVVISLPPVKKALKGLKSQI
ncbi:energy-coupled thiamine transporter ThiT [Aminicella lysinilytica]|uniref:Thiamine transporter n=1 Tax=Aminicella lysinilytica TaxID=433323 RepID=A0A4R6Q8D3_9FIRM|nr:energy-coupled thiamine transporter ThiT [Aminicella lysinilytica]TDP58096.1 thiamine transporter [Aminicella lysinilytica]